MLDDLCLGRFHFEAGNILRYSLLPQRWYPTLGRGTSSPMRISPNWRVWTRLCSGRYCQLTVKHHGNFSISRLGTSLSRDWELSNQVHHNGLKAELFVVHPHWGGDSLLRSCLMSHQDQLSKGDWITTLKENLDELEIDMDLESIAGLVAWQGRFQK